MRLLEDTWITMMTKAITVATRVGPDGRRDNIALPDDEYDDEGEEDEHADDAFAGRYMDYYEHYEDENDYGSD